MNSQDLLLILDQEVDKVAKYKGESDFAVKQLRDRLRRVNTTNNSLPSIDIIIQNEIKKIREILEIRANPSIEFAFLRGKPQYESVFDQLRIDNLRMENCVKKIFDESGSEIKPEFRFKAFSVYASFQIETLINLYFMKFYNGVFSDFKSAFEKIKIAKKISYNLMETNNISKLPLDTKLRFFLDWSRDTPERKLLDDALIVKEIRNGEVHRAVELSPSSSFVIPPYAKQDLDNIYKYEIMYYDIIRQVVKDFVGLVESTNIF